MYSVRPAESARKTPAVPFSVFRVMPGAELDAGLEAVVVVAAAVVDEPPPLAAGVLPPQAAAMIATAASGSPNPTVRIEILRSMVSPSLPVQCRRGLGRRSVITATRSVRTKWPKGLISCERLGRTCECTDLHSG